jgi:valyl-tRNA synthetase
VTVELDTAGAIDIDAERRRMEKDLAAARREAEQASAKLANAGFMAKAPAEVVEKTRHRLAAAEQDIARISDRLALLAR